MPEKIEIVAPEETLYQASRCWTHAANEWEAASAWQPEATLSSIALGFVYDPTSAEFAREYNECVYTFRDKLIEGAENMHGAAKALKRSAQEYIEVDSELTERLDRIIDL